MASRRIGASSARPASRTGSRVWAAANSGGGLGTGLVLRAAEVCGSGRGDGGGGRARGRGRRRMGVEHGQAPMTGVRERRDRSGAGLSLPHRSVRPAWKPRPVLLTVDGDGGRGYVQKS